MDAMKTLKSLFGLALMASFCVGCESQDVPSAHKGRMFDKTGLFALYSGGVGFEGPVLGPGTYYTGVYPEVRMVECAQKTHKEELTALTKDGVQFGLDIYISYGANCDEDKAVVAILDKLSPGWPDEANHPEWRFVVFGVQLYDTMIRPALGEAVRESVSPYIANDVNSKRDIIFERIKKSFEATIAKQEPRLVKVYSLNLSNMSFPEPMVKASTERAVQAILKDKAVAERERVSAEIETTKMRKQLAESEAGNDVVRIDAIGAALARNPAYMQFDLQQKMPDIYARAGEKGGLVIAAPSPDFIVSVPARGK